ncbi:unnamed protein product, partial [Sphagnum jensenii]
DAAEQTCVVDSGSHPKRTREGAAAAAAAAAFPVVEFCNSARKKKKQRLGLELLQISREPVSVSPSIRRRFRVLIDAAEPARTVGQFRILMDRRNRAGQIVRPGRRNSQGEETDRSFSLADEVLKAKRRSAWGFLPLCFLRTASSVYLAG